MRVVRTRAAIAAITFVTGAVVRAQTPPAAGYDIHIMSLTGTPYQYNSGGGIVRGEANFSGMNDAGQVSGLNNRYSSGGLYLGQDAWFFDGTSSHMINLTGAGYEYSTPNGTFRSGGPSGPNNSGMVSGTSTRYGADGTGLGIDSWLYNGTSTQLINPTGAGYEYALPGGLYRHGVTWGTDDGSVLGISSRFDASATDLGQDIWTYNGATQIVGLSGASYQYTSGGGSYRSASFSDFKAGKIIGNTSRFSAAGVILGSDAWKFDGTSTIQVNPTGGVYQYNSPDGVLRWSRAGQINGSGHLTGASDRYTASGDDLGTDSWVYNGTATVPINLTGPGYEYSVPGGNYRWSSPSGIGPGGHPIGTSDRYASSGVYLGQDVWTYQGGVTTRINLTGPGYEYNLPDGVYREANPGSWDNINYAGHIIGRSTRYASDGTETGSDAWYFNGSTTLRINPVGPGYEYSSGGAIYRQGEAVKLNEVAVAGNSDRFAADGSSLGRDAWVFDGSITKVLGFHGAPYEYAAPGGTFREGLFLRMNDSGQIVGESNRYAADGSITGLGSWLYNPETDTTTALEFSFSSDGDTYTEADFLTNSGVVLGQYDLYSGTSLLGRRLFWWSMEAGFHDLGSMVNGGLAANGWNRLSTIADVAVDASGSPIVIAGSGLTTGQTGGTTAYSLNVHVPEPTCVALLGLAALGMRRRR